MNALYSDGVPLNCFALRPAKAFPGRRRNVGAFHVLSGDVLHRVYPGNGRAVTLDKLHGPVRLVGLGIDSATADIVDASGNFVCASPQEIAAHPVISRLKGESRLRILDQLHSRSEREQA